ncbi:MAG: YMGG-like glycine zipper-containing protein [Ginsengibacter sp.]
MRKLLIGFAAISIFTSCNSNEKTEATTEVVGVSDSNLYKNNALADTGHFAPVAPVPEPSAVVEKAKAPKPKIVPKKTTYAPVTAGNTVTPVPSTTGKVNTGKDTVAATPATTEKKGWSNAAKGATIGGVGGAIGGAILSKKKGKGAIIGGAIGAAGGYILGRKKDKNEQARDTIK